MFRRRLESRDVAVYARFAREAQDLGAHAVLHAQRAEGENAIAEVAHQPHQPVEHLIADRRVLVNEPAGTGYRFRVGDAIASWKQLRTSVAHAREVPGLPRFLIGRFFYTDPVNTVIVVMSVFATQAIGLTSGQANLVLLGLTIAAVLASFGWGVVVERIGPKRTLMWVLASWCVGLIIGGAVLSLPTFLIAGILLGSGLGGVWTSDRVFMLRLSPPERIGEFFGLYGLAGKFSAVTGPILYGTIVSVLLNAGWGKGAYQVGILSFLVLMVIGILFLRGVPDRTSEADPDTDISPPPDHLMPAFDTPSVDRA